MQQNPQEEFEEYEEYFEQEEEQECSHCHSQASQSKYECYNPQTNEQFVSFKLQPGQKLDGTIPPNVSLVLTGISLACNNFKDSRHIVQFRCAGHDGVIARLLPNVMETAQLNLAIPPMSREQMYQFELEGEGDVDVVGMVYRVEDLKGENSQDSSCQESSCQDSCCKEQQTQKCSSTCKDSCKDQCCKAKCKDQCCKASCCKEQCCKENPKESKPVKITSECCHDCTNCAGCQPEKVEKKHEKKDPNHEFYEQQRIAKASELRIDRSMNKTSVQIKESQIGGGKTAIHNSKIALKYKIMKNGQIIDQTKEGQLFSCKLNAENVSEGFLRLILGMREGGLRTGSGLEEEIVGKGGEKGVRLEVEMELKKVE